MCLYSPSQRGRKLAAGFWGVNEGADDPQIAQIIADEKNLRQSASSADSLLQLSAE
jgi:hypothetical protein